MKGSRDAVEIFFDSRVYCGEALRLAAYVFSPRCDVRLSSSRGASRVEISAGAETSSLAGEFANEVLNQQCRIDLAAKNSRIAGMITTKALLSACGGKSAKARPKK